MTTKEEHLVITKYDLLYEQRMTRVETTLENISKNMVDMTSGLKEIRSEMKSDFRWLLGLMILFSTGTWGVMAHGFHWF